MENYNELWCKYCRNRLGNILYNSNIVLEIYCSECQKLNRYIFKGD